MDLRHYVRTIPDYPKPGIQFRDITTLLSDPKGLQLAVQGLVEPYREQPIDKVAGIEARGFIVGAPVATALGVGFVPIRKPGKLPGASLSEEYTLEYGKDRVEVHEDAIAPGERVLLVDDLIATGGTALAGLKLIERSGGIVAGCAFVIDLPDLGGRRALEEAGHAVHWLCAFEGD